MQGGSIPLLLVPSACYKLTDMYFFACKKPACKGLFLWIYQFWPQLQNNVPERKFENPLWLVNSTRPYVGLECLFLQAIICFSPMWFHCYSHHHLDCHHGLLVTIFGHCGWVGWWLSGNSIMDAPFVGTLWLRIVRLANMSCDWAPLIVCGRVTCSGIWLLIMTGFFISLSSNTSGAVERKGSPKCANKEPPRS